MDVFIVQRGIGMIPASAIEQPQITPAGAAMLASVKRQSATVDATLARARAADVVVDVTAHHRLRFLVYTSQGRGPCPLAVVVSEERQVKGRWRRGIPWAAATAALDDDAEPSAWVIAREMAQKFEGVPLRTMPQVVPWCVVVTSPAADAQALVLFLGTILDVLVAARAARLSSLAGA